MKRRIDNNLFIDINKIVAWEVTGFGVEILIEGRSQWDFYGDTKLGLSRAKIVESMLREIDESNEDYIYENGISKVRYVSK